MSDEKKTPEEEGIFVELPVETPVSAPKEDNVDKENVNKEEVNNEEPDKFRGKSREDIIKSYVELEKTHGKVTNEIGLLRKTVKGTSQEETLKRVLPDTIMKEIKEIDKQLKDEFDDDEIDRLSQKKESLYDKYAEAKANFEINKRLSEIENPKALTAFKQQFGEDGFTEDQLSDIYELAVNEFSGNTGVIKQTDLDAAALKLYGDAYKAALETKVSQRIRSEIKQADTIRTPTIVSEEKHSTKIDLSKLSGKDLKDAIRKLTPEQLELVINQTTNKIKRG